MNHPNLTKALAIAGMLASGLALAHGHATSCAGKANCEDLDAVRPAISATEGSTEAATACPAGYARVGATLCMTGALGPDTFANALAVCQSMKGTVANYGAWRYRILFGDGVPAPVGWWLGPITADDTALFVNSSDTGNFDGETSRFDSRNYACSHG